MPCGQSAVGLKRVTSSGQLPFAFQLFLVQQCAIAHDHVLPGFVGLIVPFPPETPDDLGSVGRLVSAVLFHLRAHFVPDFLADEFPHIMVAGVADGEPRIDFAVGPEIDFQFAQRNG